MKKIKKLEKTFKTMLIDKCELRIITVLSAGDEVDGISAGMDAVDGYSAAGSKL